ncbi:PD-(D/E)XK nuclease family protein [Aestuariicella sp. G3-2]|uniref:PD-(D/E)XK nuclease family protein n=1 Tax=Pseudomaricurvus albidus TaxID=2842452 RepID=UPI001C0AD38D|nr:PD-(D/E)XK nuclease family protein [Aestuariicella albida]MBU3070524.1 PD-(D/E)XK nuclease family protein [Aestuariicella albida]
MPISLFDIQPLLEPINEGVLILTPNSRLKNKLVAAYNQFQELSGAKVWEAPRAYSLSEWVSESYQLLLDQALLASPSTPASEFVLQQLWLEIIQEDAIGAELINPHKLASDAQTAYRTLQRWNLNASALINEGAAEENPLIRWVDKFEDVLTQHQLCTPEQVQQEIIQSYCSGLVPKEDKLLLLGFDDIPPLSRILFESMSCECQERATFTSTTANRQSLLGCPNQQDEIRAAACWAQSVLKKDPGASIGVIAPNLGQIRKTVEQIFVEVLEPQYSLPETARYTLPFNFSAGIPLGSVPLIHDSLMLLQLNHYRIRTEDLIELLSSPFWGIADSLSVSESLAQQLKKLQRARIKVSQLRQICHKLAQHEAPPSSTEDLESEQWQLLDQRLQHIESLRRQRAKQLLPSQWLELFESQLRHLGWPGTRRLDSNEFQQMTQWYQLQEKFCQLESTGKLFTCDEAINLLTQLAGSEHFQAQTPESPVQILGILEGAGLQFSHCWVLGMSQQNWPPAPEPNPLLPLSLQRQHGMPHADADRELAFAERLTEGYRHCAPEVVFSYPCFDADMPLQPSALVKNLVASSAEDTLKALDSSLSTGWPNYLQEIVAHQQLEWINTGTGPAVSPTELAQIRGGSQILKNQAISPFAAFALHRLGAQQADPEALGFTPMQRGQILHDALSDIWKALVDQKTLIAMPDMELKALVNARVQEHIHQFRKREPDFFGENYSALEQQRHCQLILRWLELEKQRPEFTVVANEDAIKANFAGLPLTLRLDRMDKLSDGELILIDYKTGSPTPKSWGGERPDEPQLPLYCLCYLQDQETDISAVMFAQVNAKEVAIKGLGGLSVDHPDILPAGKADSLELPTDWQLIREHWQQQLEMLATTFLQGDCSLDFKSPSLKRFYEDLAPILRWQEEDFVRDAFQLHGGQA